PETPSEEARDRNVLKSASSAATLIVARMWVVSAPPTFSVPTTVGFWSHRSGWMPSFESTFDPLLEPGEDAICEKLDSSFWNAACGSWKLWPWKVTYPAVPVDRIPTEPPVPPLLRLTVKFDCGSLPVPRLWNGPAT